MSERTPLQSFRTKSYSNPTSHNLAIFRPKGRTLEDSANFPDLDIIAAEIVEDLQAALAQFAEIASDLKR